MFIKQVDNLIVKHFKVTETDNLTENDIFDYYRSIGYDVFHEYVFYVSKLHTSKKGVEIKYSGNKHKDIKSKTRLVELAPVFNQGVCKLFRRYKTGHPDLLLHKEGEWIFIEVKTTNDSLRPNQLLFIEQLQEMHPVEIHQYIAIDEVQENMQLNKKTKATRNKKIKEDFIKDSRSAFEKLFDKDLYGLLSTKKRKGYNEYWVVVNIYKLYIDATFHPRSLNQLVHKTGINKEKIVWFINKNKISIIKEAIGKLQKKEKLSDRQIKLLVDYGKKLES